MRIYLKELRNKFQLTQEETANRLGISQNYYSMIEKGERQQNMQIDFLKNLAKVFNVSIDWVIKQENKLETR
ncbi:MAG: helix-turn-helix transcriptional regulator [Clostridiales bacterium]|nr:helix-turn-helix transcriptional regulator [Clostridiales bacterium]